MKKQPVKSNRTRKKIVHLSIMAVALLIFAVVVITAIENDSNNDYENTINIEADDEGNFNVLPQTLDFTYERSTYGYISIKLSTNIAKEDIVVSVPSGWGYFVELYEPLYEYNYEPQDEGYDYYQFYQGYNYEYTDYEAYDEYTYNVPYNNTDHLASRHNDSYYYANHNAYTNNDSYYNTDSDAYMNNNSSHYTDHEAYTYNDSYYYTDFETYLEYDYYTEYEPYNEYENYYRDIIITLIPPSLYGGYIGIMPLNSGGRRVNFHLNGGSALPGTTVLYTMPCGTLGTMPYGVSRPGARFGWWSRDPNGNDPLVTHITDPGFTFDADTYVDVPVLNLYAMWLFTVSFHSEIPLPANPIQSYNPQSFVAREIPYGWNFPQAAAFGWPVAFPVDPSREGFNFWGWYNMRVPGDHVDVPPTQPAPEVAAVNALTPVTRNIEYSARWRVHTHMVTFNMNHANANLAPGTAAAPQRLYRFVLNNRSIADSGLGGATGTGLGGPAGTQLDTFWGTANIHTPFEWARQNRQRDWIPNAPLDHQDINLGGI